MVKIIASYNAELEPSLRVATSVKEYITETVLTYVSEIIKAKVCHDIREQLDAIHLDAIHRNFLYSRKRIGDLERYLALGRLLCSIEEMNNAQFASQSLEHIYEDINQGSQDEGFFPERELRDLTLKAIQERIPPGTSLF